MCSSPLWIKVTGRSGAMEPAALLSSLCFLETCGLQISHLVTDRSLFNINEHEVESLALWEEANYFLELIMYRSTTVKNSCTFLEDLIHSCLSEKYRMGAPQWKNAFNTFLHRIIDLSWLFRLYNECWICWWYLVVTQKILVVVIGHFHTSAKLRRLCGQDFSFCGGYALTKPYSRLNRLHKYVLWAGP